MNGKVISAAIIATILITPVFAQGREPKDGDRFSIFGIIDLGVSIVDNLNGSMGSKLNSGGLQGSRLAFRGQEDLGGGFKVDFALEAGLEADDGSIRGGGFQGQSSLGMRSRDFGNVSFGRQCTSFCEFLSRLAMAPTFGGVSGAHDGIPGSAEGKTAAARFNNNMSSSTASNSIKYVSPDFGGIRFSGTYAFGESSDSSTAGSSRGMAVRYASGRIYLAAGYNEAVSASNANLPNNKVYAIGGMFYWQNFNFTAYYTSQKNAGHTSGMNADVMSVMLSHTSGNWVNSIGYSHMNDKTKENWDSDQYALSTVYSLSKTISLYSTLGHMRVKNGGIAGQLLSSSSGSKQTQIVTGIRYFF